MKMNMSSRKLGLLASASCIGLLWSAPGQAQTAEIPQPPVNSVVDARGVDLTSGQLMVSFTPLSIGDAASGLKQTLYYPGLNGFRHDQMITATADDYDAYGMAHGYHVTIATGQVANGFTWNSGTGVYVSDKGDGATLTGTSTAWTYTTRDGVVIQLDRTQGSAYTSYYDTTSYYGGVDGIATSITRPDGSKIRLTYKTSSYYYSGYGTVYATRLQSSTTSTGYQLKFNYRSNSLTQSTANDWVSIAQEQTINNKVDYCDPTADSCTTLTQSWPTMTVGSSVSGSNGILSFTDPASRTSSFTFDSSGRIIGYRRPNAASDTTTYGYVTGSTTVSSVSLANIGTWNYAFSYNSSTAVLSGTVTTPTVSTPLSVTSNYLIRQPLTVTDENGHTTTFTYDSNGRVKTRTLDGSGSNYATYSYDTRGNLTSMVVTPKSGSGLATLTTSASYPASCTIMATCNKPVTTTNSENQVTNYYYNSNGTTNYVQSPAPTSGAARPEVHYAYTAMQARVKNASGAIVGQGDTVTLPAGSTTCVTGAYSSCSSANQIVTQLAYDTGTGGTNLTVQSSTVKSGSGSPSSTTSYTYDNLGDVASVTDPLGNVATTSYGLDRQPTLAVGPSLDGSSTSNRRGVQYHYNADGLPDTVTAGAYNPNNQTLTTRQVSSTSYDTQGRKTQDSVSDGTTTYSVTSYSYNGTGHLDCSAVRMNPTAGGWSSACTAGTQGSNGPDRITHYVYDNAGQLLKTQSAYGIAGQQRDDVTYTYTNHGLQETMTDPKGNFTAFVYDGHDRPLRTCYQGTLANCQANTSPDYLQLGYNSAGRLVSRSLRGAPSSTIGYTYDYLGRVTNVSYPGGGTYDQPVAFSYDNVGRQLSATDGAGDSVSYSYDALGNVVSQGDGVSSRTMLYDADGRRTRLTWSDDGRYVTYEYDGASDLTAIKESGSTLLASFAYDDIGRRSSLTMGNGVMTSYSGYSPFGPATISHDLTGTASDVALGLSYNAAGQIISRSVSNNAYVWNGAYNVNRAYTTNGLNQYTASGSVAPGYDARGNLTTSGTTGFAYSTKNELVSRTDTGVSFYHDPLGRLDTISGTPSGSTRFQYDGAHISVERDASNAIARRYVWGAGDDEPLVWYEGSDFSNKRFLSADERGSVIAVTDSSGNALTINSYDEYGVPGAYNTGRFQYTGQAWVSELGMYSYKARMYSPTMGRFMQTDPSGYPDGPNWYAYAGNDPVNGKDPSGTTYCDAQGVCSDDGSNDITAVLLNNGSDLGDGFDTSGGITFNDGAIEAAANAAFRSQSIWNAQINGGRQPQSGPCGSHPILGALGKLWSSPNTALGLLAAGGSYVAGKVEGTNPSFQLGNNSIQLLNSPLNVNNRAYTLGNVQVYGVGDGPSRGQISYTGAFVNTGMHEEGHTVQGQILGPLYLPAWAAGRIFGGDSDKNPMESGADKYAQGQSCSGF